MARSLLEHGPTDLPPGRRHHLATDFPAAARTVRGRLPQAIEQQPPRGGRRQGDYGTGGSATGPGRARAGHPRQKGGLPVRPGSARQSGELNLRRMGRLDVIGHRATGSGQGHRPLDAQMFLIFSLSRLDVLPVDDLGVRMPCRGSTPGPAYRRPPTWSRLPAHGVPLLR